MLPFILIFYIVLVAWVWRTTQLTNQSFELIGCIWIPLNKIRQDIIVL